MSLGNRTTRIIVAIIAIPILLFIAVYGKIPFLLLGILIALASFHEFGKMAEAKGNYVNYLLGFPAVFLIVFNVYSPFIIWEHLFISIFILILLYELFRNRGSAINNLGSSLLGILYTGLFSGAIVALREFYSGKELIYDNGGYIIISVMITIWVCDSAAYFLGTAFGKHKLYPRVSPNKSWEGAAAGFIFAIISAVALKTFLLDFLSWQSVIAMGVIVGIFGQIGDLAESLIKRDSGVKDSSSIIPGHGGMFDRFDSLLFTAPILYIYLYYFA